SRCIIMNKKVYQFSVFIVAILIIASCGEEKHKWAKTKPEKEEDPITGFFHDEVGPPNTRECFPGAYYRKVVSSRDDWIGIEGTVILPEITFDEERINPEKPSQYLDNPTVY